MQISSTIKMPEWLVFFRAVLLGAALAEIWWIGFLSSEAWGKQLANGGWVSVAIGIVATVSATVIAYAYQRKAHEHARRIIASRRFDLGVLALAGVWIDYLLKPQLAIFHDAVSSLDNGWSQAMLAIFFTVLTSAALRPNLRFAKTKLTQLYFIPDAEICAPDQDALNVAEHATNFADMVLTSAERSGMVFGVDGPWGVGKTSFLNIATRRWIDVAKDSVIVFKFEPLRYASEPDLSERFIKDLCAKIQQQVFVPEFLPAATRYSKMLKGKTDVSFLGVKLTIEASNETIDDLLGDIDDLLEEVDRRLIVIIDDLDRLEPKLINNVLFTVRRTFKLSRATYILCYDTEMLVAGKDEGSRAREFLEKFITAKLSLFIDLRDVKAFLETDWHADASSFQTIPQNVMFELRQITSQVALLLSGQHAYHYIPLLGDLRKVKRFVNAMLLMQLGNTDIGRSDFHHKDLIHLILLHLCYPGLFRKIHAEETEGRVGSFSVRCGEGSERSNLFNAPGFKEIKAEPTALFLLKELFDVETIDFPSHLSTDEEFWRSRACFNFEQRNLEKYLQLIVRFKAPAATTTFKMYKDLLNEVVEHKKPVAEILKKPVFATNDGERVHEQFWQVLVNNAHLLDRNAAEDAIATLISWLPHYSMLDPTGRSLRQQCIYSLVFLLDRAGFGEPRNGRGRSSTDVVEIAQRILGNKHLPSSQTLIQQLVTPERGPLGWEDLMLFRLTCCADRLGQFHNIYSALVRYEESSARAEGDVNVIANNSMRRFTQQVFQEFKKHYIDQEISFFNHVDQTSDIAIIGDFEPETAVDVENDLKATRSSIKSFVIYQLANQGRNTGSGIGCGVYDEFGKEDSGGIHRLMCEYLLDFCFNPKFGLSHARAFGDYCLRALREEAVKRFEDLDVFGVQAALTNLIGAELMKKFWASHGEQIKKVLRDQDGIVISYHYKATYKERLPLVFEALDQLLSNTLSLPNESVQEFGNE